MVGRLVEYQHVRLHDKCTGQCDTLFQSAGQLRHEAVRVQLQARQRGVDLVLQGPSVARVQRLLRMMQAFECGRIVVCFGKRMGGGVVVDQQTVAVPESLGDRLKNTLPRRDSRFLADACQFQAGCAPDFAVVGRRFAGDDF